MKKFFSIIISIIVVITASAMESRITQINDIKKNKEFLYGDATMPTREEAASVAYELIQQEVLNWASDRVSRPIQKVSPRDINNLVDTIVLRRADMFRVFAYVKKSKLVPMFYDKGIVLDDLLDIGIIEGMPQLMEENPNVEAKPETNPNEEESTKSMINDKVKHQLQQRFFGPKNGALYKIINARNFFELKHILPPLKADGSIINYGKLATAENLEECYLIVYDIAGNIKALLGKGEETRPNLKTGITDRLDNYRGCGAIWFTLKN